MPKSNTRKSERKSLAINTPKPIKSLAVWLLTLIILAVVMPLIQKLSGLPFELISLIMLAPALASLVLLVRKSWTPTFWQAVPITLVIRASLIAIVVVSVFYLTLATLTGWQVQSPATGVTVPVTIFLALQLIGVFAEEFGWRGFVQRLGENFANPAVVSAIAGFLFGITHLGYWSLGFLSVLTFGTTAMLMSLTITTIFKGSLMQRMIPAVIIHLGVNLTISSLTYNGQPLATTFTALVAAMLMLAAATSIQRLFQIKASNTKPIK